MHLSIFCPPGHQGAFDAPSRLKGGDLVVSRVGI